MPLLCLPAKPAAQAARLLRGSFLLALPVAAAMAMGCGGTRTAPPKVVQNEVPDSPEGKLERVMKRLESALIDAQAAAGSGVKSQRKSSYRLIPPGPDEPNYKAEVTIVTHTKLANDADAASPADGGPEATGSGGEPEAVVSEPVSTRQTFVLVYEDDRWRLLKPPTEEERTEKILFDYALDL
jgi:hypothetical protein